MHASRTKEKKETKERKEKRKQKKPRAVEEGAGPPGRAPRRSREPTPARAAGVRRADPSGRGARRENER